MPQTTPGAGRPISYRKLFDSLPDATVLIGPDGDVRWANPAAERRMGRPLSDFLGRPGLELIHPDDLEVASLALMSVQDKEVGSPIEMRIRTNTGWRLAEVVGAPVTGMDEGLILMTLRDLTERRRWEVVQDETAKLRTVIHYAPTLLMLLDPDGCLQATSGAITRALGHDQADLVQLRFSELAHPDDRNGLEAAMDRTFRPIGGTVTPERVDVRLRDARSDQHVPYELSIVNLTDDPTVRGLIVSGHDVSERNAVENNLRGTLSLLSATLDSTADGILVVDSEGRITSFNARFVEMWRLPLDVVSSGRGSTVLEYVKSQLDDPEQFVSKVRELQEDPSADSFDMLAFADERVFERYSTPQRVDGQIVGRVWSFHDITRQKQLEGDLAHQAFHDSLTGLANQALFRDRVSHAIARATREQTDLAVLYFDVDDFKRVNDSLGHRAGDDLLVAVSERIITCLRGTDTAARLGGDEFGVLIEKVESRDDVTDVADRIIEAVRTPVTVGTKDLVASVSMGIAFGEPESDVDHLLRNADLAMYRAKNRGKGRYELYASDMHADAVARLEVESDLREAVARDQLSVAYQPIVELATWRVTGVEALLRWRHPERGEISAEYFIAAAEETGTIMEIGDFVISEACRQARRWSDLAGDRRFSMSVNLSPRQLTNPTIVDRISRALDDSGADPRLLVFELTETAMMRDTDSVARVLADLKSLGVRLALDDFGTGYSSLTHLQRFPIDIIKIDRSFMTTTGDDAALVKAVLRLSQELGLQATAEGVETAEQVEFLRSAGCQFGQGYFFAPPEPAERLDHLVMGGRMHVKPSISRNVRAVS